MHDWSEQKVLVTGANGFIGKHLVRRLVGLGSAVHTIQRDDKVPANGGQQQIWLLDLSDEAALKSAIDKIRPTITFHTAASRSEEDWRDLLEVNIKVSMTLLEACKAVGVRQLVTLGSALELHEVPPSAFAASRSAGALLMQYHAKKMAVPLTHVRTSYVYGRGMAAHKFIPSAIKALMHETEVAITPDDIKRNYVHVDDVIDASLAATQVGGKGAQAMNAFATEVHSARDIIQIIAAVLAKPATVKVTPQMIRDWDRFDWAIEASDSQKLIGWQPRVSLRAGLEDMIGDARCADVI